MKKIIFFLLFVSSFAKAQTITADQLLLDSLSGIYNNDYKVANDTINIVATKSDLLLKLDASDTTGIWQPLGNYATILQLNLKVDSTRKKALTDSVFDWINGISYFAFRDSVGTSSGTPSLTQNQIAFGDASNLLTSSSDFTYNNGIFTINHSPNNSGLQFDPVTWMQSENYMNDGDDGWSYFPNTTTAWWRNNGEWVWYDDGTNLLFRMDSGNVGIGTNAPTNTLHVKGSVRITNLGGGGTQMVTADNNGVLGVGTIPDLTNYLQSGDNVSELINDAGYITSAGTPTLNNTEIAFGDGSNLMTSSSNLSFKSTTLNVTGDIHSTDSIHTDLNLSADGELNVNGNTWLNNNLEVNNNINSGGYITGGNLSGTNTGDQDLSNYLQNGNNVSQLTNDAGYLTSSTGLSTTLSNGKFLVGNGSNVATAVTPTGDVTFGNSGAFTIGDGKVTNVMLAGSIANNKLSNSTISGISLGGTLSALSNGYGIGSFSYTGTGTATVPVDSACATCPVSKTRLSNTITALGLGTASTHATGDFFLVSNNLSEGTAATMRTNIGAEGTITAPSTTLKYWTGYKTFGSFNDTARAAISLTVSGSSGAATYTQATGVFNIPTYTASGLGAEPTITASNTAGKYWNGFKSFVTLNSDSATEGSTNLFYTSARSALKANLASPTFTGTVTIPTGAVLATPASLTLTNATGLPIVAGTTGTLTVARGGTGLTTIGGTNRLLYTTTTDNISAITTANSSVLVTDGSGIPSWNTTLPTVALGSSTATTQAFGTANTTIATTAFVLARDTTSFLTADTTTAAGTTITIPGLTFTIGANQNWTFDVDIVGQTSSSGGTRFQVVYSTTPTSSTVGYSGYTAAATPTSLASVNTTPPQSTTSWTTGATDLQAHIHGTIFNGGSACTVTIKGNPVNGAQTATFRKGSSITAKRGQ